MPEFPIPAADLEAATRAAVSKSPEHVYEGECVYFEPDGAPSCGVGHGLAALGVTLEDIERLADEKAARGGVPRGTLNGLSSLNLFTHGVVSTGGESVFDSTSYRWLDTFQSSQDLRVPWGKAATRADASVSRVKDSNVF